MFRPPLIAAALALAAALPAAAQSTDLGRWTALGDVLTTGPHATLTTAAGASGEATASATSALPWFALETALGLALDADTYEGSALFTRFDAAAGTSVQMAWALSTLDTDLAFADRAYAIVDGVVSPLAQVGSGAQAGTFAHVFAIGGSHTLGFAVLDVNDVTGLSQLDLGPLTVTAVPEPGSWALLLAGVAGVGALARRRAAQPTV
jgi:hypothetical protein